MTNLRPTKGEVLEKRRPLIGQQLTDSWPTHDWHVSVGHKVYFYEHIMSSKIVAELKHGKVHLPEQ